MTHLSNWIEIPAKDMKKARTFYETILQVELQEMEMGPVRYALFPVDDRLNCGALASGEGYSPSAEGVTVYLDGGPDLAGVLSRVEDAGGTVLMPKTFLGDQAGYAALFLDAEGNRIGLQSMG